MFTPRMGAERPSSSRAAWMSVPSPPSTTTRSARRPSSASSRTTSTPRAARCAAASAAQAAASGELRFCTMPTHRGTGQGWAMSCDYR